MDKLVYLLPVLGCAAMMGVMMRGGHDNNGNATPQPDPNTREEIALLRAQIATLRTAQNPEASDRTAGSGIEDRGRDLTCCQVG